MKANLKNILLNQHGGIGFVFVIFAGIIVSSMYMMDTLDFGEKTLEKNIDFQKIRSFNSTLSKSIERSLARTNTTNCFDFSDLFDMSLIDFDSDADKVLLEYDFADLKSLAGNCFFDPYVEADFERLNLDSIDGVRVKVESLNDINNVSFSRDIRVSIVTKVDSGREYELVRNYKLTIGSLALFNLVFYPTTLPDNYLDMKDDSLMIVNGKTLYIRKSQFDFDFIAGNIAFNETFYSRGNDIQLEDGDLLTWRDKFRKGIRTSFLPQANYIESFFNSTARGRWQTNMDYSALFTENAYPLMPNVYVPDPNSIPDNQLFYNAGFGASLTIDNGESASDTVTAGEKIEMTCEDSPGHPMSVVMNRPNEDVVIDFESASWTGGGKPIFCGLIHAKKLTIKTQADVDYGMFGLFYIGGEGITIEGGGRVHFFNPIDQKPLSGNFNTLGFDFMFKRMMDFSKLSASFGVNFFLPLFKTTPPANFDVVDVSDLSNNYIRSSCPTTPPSGLSPPAYCMQEQVVKKDLEAIFPAEIDNIIYFLEATL